MFRRYWAAPPEPLTHEVAVLESALFGTDVQIMETLSALILHNLFGRFPNVRVGSMEMGSSWVPLLLYRLDHVGHLTDRRVRSFGGELSAKPSDIFKEHIWVSPFPEEHIPPLVDLLGADHVLMGSDFPHGEGTPQPADYVNSLKGLDDATVRRIMRENALELICP